MKNPPHKYPAYWLGLVVLLCLPLAAVAQVNNPAYADYFLVGRFGEICTMCEAVVLCEAGDADTQYDAMPADGNFTIYHLQTRTFWSQVSTIWEWFITNFDSESLASGHSRPVLIYTVSDTNWSGPQTLEAHVSLDPATIVIGDQTIDRIERRWLERETGQPVGFCQRLPLWESLDIVSAHQPAGDNS
ncbi:MAG: hypothetical protein QF897_08330 [Gammaproteobacteria bacterium]|jgi:hypothetical protein|nr:hypothetical protein [Chromatiales bacterium]MDP7154437.1 hypothetical protein [Gammaproteobacteria bacterium]MDP7297376.1 hypothetical protein [Gammaproteobacteria bacterium]HJP05341.1 hypothetical protein [Gammaproteobacteria bacterium]